MGLTTIVSSYFYHRILISHLNISFKNQLAIYLVILTTFFKSVKCLYLFFLYLPISIIL